MEYKLKNKVFDIRVLSEILQNRFSKFDDSVVQWRYKGKDIFSKDLEAKLCNNYNNKKENDLNSFSFNYHDWIDIFDDGLVKLNYFNRQPILFFSGGKDSTFIASRLVQNKIKALYYCFVQNNDEKKIIEELAEKLNIRVFYTHGELKYLNFDDILRNVKEPVLDPAGLSVLSLFDISKKNKINFQDTIFLDGMGNDCYMGHLPGKRELWKLFFQKFFLNLNLHKIIPINTQNLLGKFGDLLRPHYTAHFPGSTIKLNNYYNQIKFYQEYQKYGDIVLQRAIQRGIHYDFCSAISKSIIYADACNQKSKVFFPFLDDNLIDFYENSKVKDYDYSKSINKLSIRKYLNDNLNFDKISPYKGIFKPTYFDNDFTKDQKALAHSIKINIAARAQCAEYFPSMEL